MNRRPAFLVLIGSILLCSGGCFGPATVRQSRDRYNEAIRQTNNEELLLNLVRLRYNEHPSFLPITGLNAQFALTAGAQYRGGPERGAIDNFGDGTLSYSDRPTLSFGPQRPPELTKALLTQVSLDTLYLFTTQAGGIERVLRLFVRAANGVDNAISGGGPMPRDPPRFAEFRAVGHLLGHLETQGNGVLTIENRVSALPQAIPVENLQAHDVVEIKKAGYGVRPIGFGSAGYELTETKPVRVLQIHPRAIASAEMLELEGWLGLLPYRSTYPVEEAPEGQFLRMDEDPPSDKLTLTNRSILEVMYLLSKTVEVPEEHCRKGLALFARNPDGSPFDWNLVIGDLFHVCVSRHRPDLAYVAVKYRDFWYSIRDDDLSSKTTLNLFSELLRLQKIGAVEGQPILSLPLGP